MPWTYVSPISTRLLVGTFTPAIRATSRSPLPLLVARVRADNEDAAAPPDQRAQQQRPEGRMTRIAAPPCRLGVPDGHPDRGDERPRERHLDERVGEGD